VGLSMDLGRVGRSSREAVGPGMAGGEHVQEGIARGSVMASQHVRPLWHTQFWKL
jgi:hypothetical protein